jgi:ABC-type lipoprotein release transport system permease subunit
MIPRGARIARGIPILRYALANIFKNKRRSLTAIVGVVLAITLITGENISVDTTANSMLLSTLEFVPVDFTIKTDNDSIPTILNALSGTKDVVRADVATQIDHPTLRKWGADDNESISLIGIRPESEDNFVEILSANYQTVQGFTGAFQVTKDGIMLQGFQADALGVGIGDAVYLETISSWFNGTGWQNETRHHNLTVSSIIDIQLGEGIQVSEGAEITETAYYLDVSFVHIGDRSVLVEALNITSSKISIPGIIFDAGGFGSENYSYYVWVDRDKFITIGDVDKTKENYVRMGRALKNSLAATGLGEGDYSIDTAPVITIIEGFNFAMMIFRMGVLAVSLPAFALGIYLSLISIEVGMTRRRRELGILKARGATSRQLFSLLFTEAVILGIIAGIIGLLLGIVVSSVFLAITPVASLFTENLYGIYISTWSIFIAVLFAIVMIIIASYRPTRRITGQPGIVMLRTRAEDELTVPYKATWDIIFIALGIFTFSLMLIMKFVSLEGLFVFLCILDLVLIVMTPLSSFFLIIGITRLLTRGSTKIYDKMSRAVKFITKDLWYIVNRNIVRNPRRTSNVCLLIAIGLAFGLVVSTYMETEYAYGERGIIGRVGGDLAVDMTYDANISFADNLTAVDGVELLTPVISLSATTGEMIRAFNSSVYYDIVEPEQVFFSEGDARQTIQKLESEDNVIINEYLADNHYLRVGDVYTTGIFYPWPTPVEYHNLSVVGIAKVMPGTGGVLAEFVSGSEIYTDLKNINISAVSQRSGSISLRFLIKVGDGYDHASVADDIRALSPSVVGVTVLEEELETLQDNPITGALYNALLLIYFFVILIITFGLGLVVYITVVEREHELAGFIARGASTKQVSSLLFGEGMTVMLVGVIIGVLTGLLAAFMINELITFVFSGIFQTIGYEVAIERVFVVSWFSLALIIITIIALVVASFAATLRVRRIKLAQALRERGG